jgi:hypothetical protein
VEKKKAGFTLRYFYCAAAGGHFLQMDGVALDLVDYQDYHGS